MLGFPYAVHRRPTASQMLDGDDMNDYDTPEIRCSSRNLSRVTEWGRPLTNHPVASQWVSRSFFTTNLSECAYRLKMESFTNSLLHSSFDVSLMQKLAVSVLSYHSISWCSVLIENFEIQFKKVAMGTDSKLCSQFIPYPQDVAILIHYWEKIILVILKIGIWYTLRIHNENYLSFIIFHWCYHLNE